MNPPRYIIRFRGDWALKFHTNLRGPVFELVADNQATQFDNPEAAIETAIRHGIHPEDVALHSAEGLEAA